ncbi:BREX-1 system adenine-specific DNA-methyltransferase PglX [Pseudomonas sp. EggHat1]|uniref:BREX-1 system adenine-specific DNA-methyltransferase PglX n=1 Tax=Pseudomonas sp. EggHat1 TaxID=2761624 RepID=UPI001868A472|nr:BREX-1 system adenine-specific DNA-methyltransferase PglX [Pseudomonas sp. EggHat1]
MNRSALKKYAPQARLDFIEAVTLRARRLGLDPTLPVSVEQTGDVLLIGGQPFPASVAKQRSELARRIQQQGFAAVVEALAYTWFNRFVAIRFMELKGYLSHGYRVLSHPEGALPEILEHAHHLDLPGLDKEEVIRLKTAGNQDEALYREILLAQCHELYRNMPFLFEALDDATELLLPDNLLRTDSLIARLVSDIDEGDWEEVEVIGWLYQFYISGKKDEVIGKVVKSEDIPAATQLFTPNWIVQYLVQNSLGRLWQMANPHSNLKEKMPYYIEPAEQTPEVQAQLDALIKVRMDEDGGTLNPESLTVLDPACGSGHILVEAYNLLRAIYEERGYRLREIPRLILQKNLYGLDIDDRAAQLAGFALLMKAREDDRRLFEEEGNPPHLNVMAIQQSAGLPDEEIARVILNAAIQIEGGDAFHSGQLFGGGQLETQHSSGLTVLDLRQLIQLFEHGKTFGSLISVPDTLKAKLGKIVELLATVQSKGDDLSRSYACQVIAQFAIPASLLALSYDVVVANPPYMGGKGMNQLLKSFGRDYFPCGKADLFAMFIERGYMWCKLSGFISMVTMQAWMFLSSFEEMRIKMLKGRLFSSLVHIGYNSFPEMNSKIAQACAFVHGASKVDGYCGSYINLNCEDQSADKSKIFLERDASILFLRHQEGFQLIGGAPLAYWASENVQELFAKSCSLSEVASPRAGLATGDNTVFQRYWHEVSKEKIGFGLASVDSAGASKYKWFPCNSGGSFRKWYGNHEIVVDWESDGYRIRNFRGEDGKIKSRPQNTNYFFREGITWTKLSTGVFAARYKEVGFVFDDTGRSAFPDNAGVILPLLALLCSNSANYFLSLLNASLSFTSGDIAKIPIPEGLGLIPVEAVREAIEISRKDWDAFELSWNFRGVAFDWDIKFSDGVLANSWRAWSQSGVNNLMRLKEIEESNNSIFIKAFGLRGEISPLVPESQITLARANREQDMQRLISYAVGCVMGRYSLDEPGLIYAHSGGCDFDHSRYTEFPADGDGIIPVTDEPWFEDDAAERVREFVKVVWGGDTLVENMEWLADSLGRKAGESADEAIRRYLSTSFYKDHLQAYKKRPIYWLFSSGKQKAFECLVYLHRYNEGTLSRMRMEYVVPLQSRMQARIDKLTDDIDSATSSAQQKALQKRKDKLTKQLEELRRFDENLRPYADQRITLDLDDGVKVNYGKFGNLLAEVKAVTGGKEE